MALRQREWVIYVRPYMKRTAGANTLYKIDHTGGIFATGGSLGITGSYHTLRGYGEGGGDTDDGAWMMWLKTSSFKHLREKYKELLKDTPVQHIRVTELINVDTMITPIS